MLPCSTFLDTLHPLKFPLHPFKFPVHFFLEKSRPLLQSSIASVMVAVWTLGKHSTPQQVTETK